VINGKVTIDFPLYSNALQNDFKYLAKATNIPQKLIEMNQPPPPLTKESQTFALDRIRPLRSMPGHADL
jgi:hypothetical protein